MLESRLAEFEALLKEVEDKNKRLVDMLNSGIYNKAEDYKIKVMARL